MSGSPQVCRTCLRSEGLAPIFARKEHRERYTVALFLTTGLWIDDNDGLPQTICSVCIELVNSAINFRNLSHRTEWRLLRVGHHRSNDKPQSAKNKKKVKLKRKDEHSVHRDSNADCIGVEDHIPKVKLKSKLSNELCVKDFKDDFDYCDNLKTIEDLADDSDYKYDDLKLDLDDNLFKDSVVSEALISCNNNLNKNELVDTSNGNELPVEKKFLDGESLLPVAYSTNENPSTETHIRKGLKARPPRSNKEKRALLLSLADTPCSSEGPVRCRLCQKTVATWSSFRSHCKLHLGFDFICEYCGKSFISITQLRRHKSSRHGEARALACARCPYRALDKPQLLLHERREHTGERPFVCDACGASYHSRRCLIQHIETHNTARTVQCTQCPSLFKSRRHLARHTYAAHPRAHRYRCVVCRQLYRRLKYARRHMRKMHGLSTREQGGVEALRV